jgi:hypothetical protein
LPFDYILLGDYGKTTTNREINEFAIVVTSRWSMKCGVAFGRVGNGLYNPSRMKRLIKNSFWYMIVMAVGILWYDYSPLQGIVFWVSFVPLAGVTWTVVSKLRERLKF